MNLSDYVPAVTLSISSKSDILQKIKVLILSIQLCLCEVNPVMPFV